MNIITTPFPARNQRQIGLSVLFLFASLVLALAFALVLPHPVYADDGGETPPPAAEDSGPAPDAPPSDPPAEPSDGVVTEVDSAPVDSGAGDDSESEEPPAQEEPPTSEEIPDSEELIIIEDLPITDEPVIPDPYFEVGGTRHTFLPDGANCGGDPNCHTYEKPVQEAFNAAAGYILDGDTIYIDGGTYAEDLIIDGTFASGGLNGLILQATGMGGIPVINGNVLFKDLTSFTFNGVTVLGMITIQDSTGINFVGTTGADVIQVNITGNSGLSVDGSGGDDVLTVNGTAAADAFTLTDSTVSIVNTSTALITYSDVETLGLKGAAGTDTLNVTGLDLDMSYAFDYAAGETFTILGFNPNALNFVNISGAIGFKQDASGNVVVVGHAMTASLTAGSSSLTLSNASFGLKMNGDAVTFELTGGAFAGMIAGLSSITAASALVQYASATGGVAQGEVLSVGGLLPYTFADAIAADTVAFGATDFSADVAGFVHLNGDLGFKKVVNDIWAVGGAVSASLNAGVANVSITDADFGLKVSGDALTFELKNGVFAAAIAGFANITAASVLVQYTSATGGAAKDEELEAGGMTYTFADAIAADTVAFGVTDFAADVAGFVHLSGDLGFKKVVNDIWAVGDDVNASLDAGVASVSLSNADFGLKMIGAAVTFELKNGIFAAAIAGLANITADSVLVQYASATGGVALGETFSAGGLTYTFTEAIAANTSAFGVTNFVADVAGFVHLSGDLGFKKVLKNGIDNIWAVGDDVSASLSAGTLANVSVINADFGLIVDDTQVTFELKNGTFNAHIPGVIITATSVLVQFASLTGGVAQGAELSAGGLTYTFDEAIAGNTVVFEVTGFAVVGAPNADGTAIETEFFHLDGVFSLELSSTVFSMFVAAEIQIGPSGFADIFGMTAVGLVIVDADGLAVNLELQGNLNLGSLLTTDISFFLILNTTSLDKGYKISERFLQDGYLSDKFIENYVNFGMGASIASVGLGFISDLNDGTLPEDVLNAILASGNLLGAAVVTTVYKNSWWEVSDGTNEYVIRLDGGVLDIRLSLGDTFLYVPSGTPNMDGTLDNPQSYFVLFGQGSMIFADALFLDGMFRIVISETAFDLQLETAFVFRVGTVDLFSGSTVGNLEISSDPIFGFGILGYLELNVDVDIPDTAGFDLTGLFQFEINTFSSDQQVSRYKLDVDGHVIPDGSGGFVREMHTIASLSLIIFVGGELKLSNVFVVVGSTEIVFSRTSLELKLYGKTQVGDFGELLVSGSAGLYDDSGVPAFACAISVVIDFNITGVRIYGNGTFQINTSQTTAHLGLAPVSFKIGVNGTVEIAYILKISANVEVLYQGGVFRIALNNGNLNFFNIYTISVSGFIQSDGQYEVYGQMGMDINLFIVHFVMNTSVHAWNCNPGNCLMDTGGAQTGLSIHFNGGITVNLIIATATATFDVEATVTSSFVKLPVSANLSVSVGSCPFCFSFNVTFKFEKVWTWGPLPILAYQLGDVLYLNVGADGYRRGENYASITEEILTIENLGGNNVRMHGLGVTQDYFGVNQIIADFGGGDDRLIIDRGVSAAVIIAGGMGDDSVTYMGAGSATLSDISGTNELIGGTGVNVITGGTGSDTLRGTDGVAYLYGNGGNDYLYGGNNADELYGHAGDDLLDGGAGNDLLYGGAGNDTINGDDGDDTFVFENGYGNDTVNETSGNDTLDFDAVSAPLTVTFGNAAFTDTQLLITSADGIVTHIGSGIENILAGSGNDVFHAYAYNNSVMLDGRNGSDTFNFYGGTGTYTVNDRGSIADLDVINVIGTAGADVVTFYSDGFQYNAQRVYATGLTSGAMQGTEKINVLFGEGDNTLYVLGSSPETETTVESGAGNDTFHVGYDVTELPRMVLNILGELILQAGDGLDQLFVDDRFNVADVTGAMTSSAFTGFGIALSMMYFNFEQVKVYLGTGSNNFTITSTDPDATNTVLGGSGADTVTITSTSSYLELDTGAGADVITVDSTGAESLINAGNDNDTLVVNNTGGETTFNLGGGEDHATIHMTGGDTTFNGGDSADTFILNGSGGVTLINAEHGDDFITINGTGGTTTVNGDQGIDTITINMTGGVTVVNGGTSLDYLIINGAGGTTTVNGDRPEDNVNTMVACDPGVSDCPGDDRFFINAADGSLIINGGIGADKYFISSGLSKDTFTGAGGYNDDVPLPSMTGDLSGILGALIINGWADGNGGYKDRVYISDLLSSADSTGLLGATLTGLSMGAGASIGFDAVEEIQIQLGSGHNTFNVQSVASTVNVVVYGGSGNDTLNVGNDADTLHDIDGMLTFYGQTGTDTLNAYNSGDTSDTTGQLTAINLTGLGMGTNSWLSVMMERDEMFSVPLGSTPCTDDNSCAASIYFGTRNDSDVLSSDVETVNVYLGTGNDTFRVDSAFTGETNVYGNSGNDRFEVESTPYGLHPNDLRRVEYIFGDLNLFGEAGSDYIIVNASGASDPGIGWLEGSTVTGLDMAGAITFASSENLEISLGAQNDTFYLRSAPAGMNTLLKTNGGFDTVYVGSVTNTLDDILGTLTIEGGLPFAGDKLFIYDTGNTSGRAFSVTNDPDAVILMVDDPENPGEMMELHLDETTISILGGGTIKYQTFETVALNAGSGADTLTLWAVHNDRDPLGGFNATFTFNAGDGNDTMTIGQPVTGGKTLNLIDIFFMLNGQGGTDTVYFDNSFSLLDNTLAFVGKTFTDIFPVGTDEWAADFAEIFNESDTLTRAALYTAIVLGYASTPAVRVMNIGAYTREMENIHFTLGAGNDIFKLDDGTYREAITVNAGDGNDTFNVANDVVTEQLVTLNGGQGDDTLYVDFVEGAPAGTVNVTFNGGENSVTGDLLRFAGDGECSGNYTPSATQARSGVVTVDGSLFTFTGIEPLVVNGFGSFQLTGTDALTDLAIESVDLTDMNLSTLVLHVLLVDGVISWRQQVKLDGVGAKDTTNFGQSVSWDGNTLAIGAARSSISITDKNPITDTITDFLRSNNVASGTTRLAEDDYFVEMRENGGGDWEFRLVDSLGAVVPVADVNSGPALVADWQDVPANKVMDTMRGLMIAFGANEAGYSESAGSFHYSVGQYPGVVYIFTKSGANWTEQAKLSPSDGEYAGQGFGSVVSLSGDVLLVGAPQDVSLGLNAGAAYIFTRTGENWQQTIKLKASDGAANDAFGSSVLVNGTTAVVGAPGDDSSAGAAYVFAFGSGAWGQAAKLIASDRAAGDLFGASVAYAGGKAAIGAPGDDSGRGSVYVFNGSGATWTQSAKLISSSQQAGEKFGSAVAMTANRIVVGAPYYDGKNLNQGAAFVYNWNGSAWILSARLTADGGLPETLAQNEGRADDHFGAAVALSGDYVLVGAPDYDDVAMNQGAVYAFMYLPSPNSGASGMWLRSKNKIVSSAPAENERFGTSLSMYGVELVVGIPGFNETDANNNIIRAGVGTVRFYATDGVFNLNNMSDTVTGLYRADTVNLGGTNAGYEMLYHPASQTLFVGDPGAGYVYVYVNEGLYWRLAQTLSGGSQFGFDMDISGNTLVVGAPGANAVYVYTYDDILWNYAATIGGGGSGGFGYSVALDVNAAGGNLRIAVGAPNTTVWYQSVDSPYGIGLSSSGAVFTYVGSGSSWSYERFIMPYDGGMPNTTYYWAYWTPYLVIYEHPGFAGVGIPFYHGDVPWICGEGCFPNDWISSIILGSYTWVHFYSDYGLGGNMLPLSSALAFGYYPDLGGWQDQISSFGLGCNAPYPNCSSMEPLSFSGLNGAAFGSEVELVGDTVYVGASGNSRLYTVNLGNGNYGYWSTNFGAPLVASTYAGGYSSIDELIYNGGVNWNSEDNTFSFSPSGTYRIISDPYADYDNGNGGSIADTGSSDLYINDTLIGTLSSGDNSIKLFGLAPVVAGDAFYSIGSNNANMLFNYRQFGPEWTYTGISLLPSALPTSKFGSSVAIDGMTAVVGARDYDQRGAAFVFERDDVESETWSMQTTLQSLDIRPDDQFGISVSISGETIIVGALNANLDHSGAAYIFERVGDVWTQQAKLTASDGAAGSLYGFSTGISADTAVVGAPGANGTYIYVRNGFTWTQQQKLSGAGNFGTSVAVDVDTLIVGAPHANGDKGAAYIYYRTAGIWSEQANITPVDASAGDRFGSAVDVEADRAIIGAPGQNSDTGAAYLYTYDGTIWSQFDKFFLGSSEAGDNFGNAVAISGDRIVIGAYLRDVSRTSGGNTTVYQDEGSAYVYGFKDGAWRLETIVEPLQASDGYSGDMMGYSVAISGSLIITGAPQFFGRIGGLATDGGGYIYITAISPPLSVTQPETVENTLLGAKAGVFSDAAGFISPLYLFDTLSMVVDLSAGVDTDIVTIGEEGVTAYGLAALVIKTGEGDDTLNILSNSVRLPTEGKVMPKDALLLMPEGLELTPAEANDLYVVLIPFFKFDGGLGVDTLNIPAADTDFTLTDTLLVDGNNSKLRLAGVEVATLIGGASANTFTVTKWSGKVTLDGMGGSDRYIISVGNITELHLTDSGIDPADEDRLTALGSNGADDIEVTATLIIINGKSLDYGGAAGIEVLTLGGLAGDDTITIGDTGIGEVHLDGGHGSDTYILNVADTDANYYVYDAGTLGTDALILNGSDLADSFIVDETFVSVNDATVYYSDALESFTLNALGGSDLIHINNHIAVPNYYYGGEGNDRFNLDTVKPNGISLIDGQNGNDVYWIMHPENIIGPAVISDSGSAADTDYLLQAATEGDDNVTVTSSGVTGIVTNPDAFLQFVGLEGMGIDLLGGNDTITISGVPNGYALAVYGGLGNDTMYVSAFASLPNHEMLLVGGDGYSMLGIDNLILDASDGTTGTLTEDSLTGFGLQQAILYEAFTNITLNLGNTDDTLVINSTIGSTTVNANGGNDTVTINATGAEGTLAVYLGAGSDTLNVNIVTIPVTMEGGAGNDTFNVNALETDQTLNGGEDDDTINIFDLGAELTVNGENGADVINVNDTADTQDNLVTLTATTLTGIFNAGGSLIYNTIETLNLNFGSGADVLDITDTHAGSTTVNMNGGADTVNVNAISGATLINASDDIVNVIANGVNAVLTVTGLGSADTLNVDDTADTQDNTATLTATSLTGIFNASGSLLYNTIETLNLNFGSGADVLNVNGTQPNDTIVHLNGGADVVNINGTDAAGTLSIYGDAGGDTFNLNGMSHAAVLDGGADDDIFNVNGLTVVQTLNGSAGNDTFNIRAITAALTINAGAGDNIINVVSADGSANGIAALLTINGEDGTDTLNVSDYADTLSNALSLTETTIGGIFGAGGSILYGTVEFLNLTLGSITSIVELTLGMDTTLIGDNVTFDNPLDCNDYSLTIIGDTTINTDLVGLQDFIVNGDAHFNNGSVTTLGDQTYNGAVTLLGDATLNGADLTFEGAIDGAFDLTINASGVITFKDVIGGTSPLDTLTITSAQPLVLTQDIFVSNDILITIPDTAGADDDLTITNNARVQSINGSVTFTVGDDITLLAGTTVQAAGAITLNGDLEAGNADVEGAVITLSGTLVASSIIINSGADDDTMSIGGEFNPTIMELHPNMGANTIGFQPAAHGTVYIYTISGEDTLDFSLFDQALNLDISNMSGEQVIAGSGATALILNIIGVIANVNGTEFNDTIIGNDADNIIHGNGGDDNLYGRDGDDIIYGDAGDDYIDGGAGADITYGGTGTNSFYYDPQDTSDGIIRTIILPAEARVELYISFITNEPLRTDAMPPLYVIESSQIKVVFERGGWFNIDRLHPEFLLVGTLTWQSTPYKDHPFVLPARATWQPGLQTMLLEDFRFVDWPMSWVWFCRMYQFSPNWGAGDTRWSVFCTGTP